ncbi:hypothetical protein IWX49DRAFT_635389 [Phyllosticta citricarpa]
MMRTAMSQAMPQHKWYLLPEIVCQPGARQFRECFIIYLSVHTRLHDLAKCPVTIEPESLAKHASVPKPVDHFRFKNFSRTIEELIARGLPFEELIKYRWAISVYGHVASVICNMFFDHRFAFRWLAEAFAAPFQEQGRRWNGLIPYNPNLFEVNRIVTEDLTLVRFERCINFFCQRSMRLWKLCPLLSKRHCLQQRRPQVDVYGGRCHSDRLQGGVKSIEEVLEIGGSAAHLVNKRIKDDKQPLDTRCCSEDQVEQTLHSCSMCLVQTLCSALTVREIIGHSVRRACFHADGTSQAF